MRSKVSRLKNTIYRIHRSDPWGFIIQKWKNDRITRFLLMNFEYLFIKSFLSIIRNTPQPRYFSDWVKRRRNTSAPVSKKEILTTILGYDQFSATRIKNLDYWAKFKTRTSRDYLKPTFNINLIRIALFLAGESSSRNFLFNSVKVEGGFNTWHLSNIYQKKSVIDKSKETTLNKWLHFDPTFIRLQKFKPFYKYMPHWWRFRMLERKMTFFYSFSNVKKFRQMQYATFYTNKLRLDSILRCEGLLCIVLFRLNLFTSMYFINNFIKSGNVLVNGKPVYSKHYIVKLSDDISIKKNVFVKVFNSFWLRLKSKRLLINTPDYIISNYKILTFSIWRYPTRLEVIAPYDFPFDSTPYDLSIGRRKPAFSLGP